MSKESILKVGSKCVIVQDCELRGQITIGTGCVIHPKATIYALGGPIVIGDNNIFEESTVVINRSKLVMTIGNDNHFRLHSRIESPAIGSNNIFEPKSRTSHLIAIGSNCHIGAGCNLVPSPFPSSIPPPPPPPMTPSEVPTTTLMEVEDDEADIGNSLSSSSRIGADSSTIPNESSTTTTTTTSTTPTRQIETIPDGTVIFGIDSTRRNWSGEGIGQAKAFHVKHLIYLRETLLKYHKLKIF